MQTCSEEPGPWKMTLLKTFTSFVSLSKFYVFAARGGKRGKLLNGTQTYLPLTFPFFLNEDSFLSFPFDALER
jgi:hypothetical protein